MVRVVLGSLLLAHGLIHASYLAPRPSSARVWPFDLGQTWLVSGGTLREYGIFLSVLATAAFVLAGLGVLGVPVLRRAWRVVALLGATASLYLLGLFWDAWLLVGLLISLAVVLRIIWRGLPPGRDALLEAG